MSFEKQIRDFNRKVLQRYRDIYVLSTMEVNRSVVEGSEITGAPGQPVQTGNLKTSWHGEFTSAWMWELTTYVTYAPDIEAGTRLATGKKLKLRSEVGGFHSVARTRAGWQNIADFVVMQVVK